MLYCCKHPFFFSPQILYILVSSAIVIIVAKSLRNLYEEEEQHDASLSLDNPREQISSTGMAANFPSEDGVPWKAFAERGHV